MFPYSWKAPFPPFACVGTMNPVGRAVPCPPRTWWVARLVKGHRAARTDPTSDVGGNDAPGMACWSFIGCSMFPGFIGRVGFCIPCPP